MAQEYEIKLIPSVRVQVKLLDSLKRDSMDEVVRKISDALGLSDTYELIPRGTEVIHDVYYDTGDADLFLEQSSLRVRYRGDKISVTLKRNRNRSEGTFLRDEDDIQCDQTTVQRMINEGFVELRRGRLDHLSGKHLVQMLIVKNSRRIFLMQPLHMSGPTPGFSAELSFDMFAFQNAQGRSSKEMYELEIESLNPNSAAQLKSVADKIQTLTPNFKPSTESKYERGVRYFKLNRARVRQLLGDWAANPYVTWTVISLTTLIGIAGLILATLAL